MRNLLTHSVEERLRFLQDAFHSTCASISLLKEIAAVLGFRVTSKWDAEHECPVFEEISVSLAS